MRDIFFYFIDTKYYFVLTNYYFDDKAKRKKKIKRQTMMHKTVQRKLKIEQHE